MPTSMPTSSAGRGRFQPSRPVSVERFLALASRNRPWRYQGWSQAELGSLARQMPLSTFSDGEHLIRSGERGTWFGLLLAGTLGVEMADGREVLLEAVVRFIEEDLLDAAGAAAPRAAPITPGPSGSAAAHSR